LNNKDGKGLVLLSPAITIPDSDETELSHEENMEKRKRVAVYGNSLYIAGIVASLKANTSMDVLCVNLDSPTTNQNLDENDLAAIVFDLSDTSLRLNFSLLCEQPDLLLIGVNPTREEMLVLSSQPIQALSMDDLVNVIHQKELLTRSFEEKTMK
jgi:hypothetical protein